ncbi:hypothetical protein [Prochlorococcus marinus]|uniref:hypothetical protein n=1 Tax=Prochlorococcus marinus TaxID=1219 RepID=UPI0039AEA9AF
MQNSQSQWYRDFILSHPKKQRQRRMDEIDNKQSWGLKEFMELTDNKFIPEEEVECFIVKRWASQ